MKKHIVGEKYYADLVLLEGTDYPIGKLYITMKMYPCSGGTDTGSPGL